MGAYESGWVRWGAGGTGEHINKVRRDKNACTGHNLGPVVGEISPDIMFFNKKKQNNMHGWLGMGVHGFAWVR